MTVPTIKYFDNNSKLIEDLASRIITALETGIKKNGCASLVVSGGSTPKTLFALLSKHDIDWSKVSITLADERCVSQADEASNARLLRENLLQNKASAANFIPLYEDEQSPKEAAKDSSNKIASIKTYDALILGMGQDGHTASLFPEAVNLNEALDSNADNCIAIEPVTNPITRITQSKQKLLRSKFIVFHLVGKDKIDILNEVMNDINKTQFPSSHFIHQNDVPVDIYFAQSKD